MTTEEAKPQPVTELTFDEVLDSMTGYDELAVKGSTEMPMSHLLQADPVHAMRAAIAVHMQRETGKPGPKEYHAAYKRAMGMTLKETRGYFTEPAKDPIPDEPDSPAGKDDSSSGEQTKTSPPSA